MMYSQAPMMDAMITRCVDDLNNYDDEVKKKRLAKGGPEYVLILPDPVSLQFQGVTSCLYKD